MGVTFSADDYIKQIRDFNDKELTSDVSTQLD